MFKYHLVGTWNLIFFTKFTQIYLKFVYPNGP